MREGEDDEVMKGLMKAILGLVEMVKKLDGRLERMERGERCGRSGSVEEEAGLEANVAGVRNVNGFRFIL